MVLDSRLKSKYAVVGLFTVFLSVAVIWRMCWAHPDIQAYTSLLYMEDIDNLLMHRYSDVSWFVLGSGHSMNLYMWFQYIEALFFNFDSRLEIPVMAAAHSLLTLSILFSLRGLIVQLRMKSQFLIFTLVPISIFSYLGMASRGMELGTFVGVAITFGIWALATASDVPRFWWLFLLVLQTFVVFTALGAYSMGVSGVVVLVCGINLIQELKGPGTRRQIMKNSVATRFFQFSIVLSLSSLAHVLAVNFLSAPSANISNMNSYYSISGLFRTVLNANAQPLLNSAVLERWGTNWTQFGPLMLGTSITLLYMFLTAYYLRLKSPWSNYLIGMLWYGTLVSLTVYPFRPYGDNWMAATWYTFHYKVSFAAAIIGIIGLRLQQRFSVPSKTMKVTILLFLSLIFSEANVIMWQRHPNERLYNLAKREAALNTELLTMDSSGMTQLGLDMQSSLRAIEIQRKHQLSVFGGKEQLRDSAIVIGMQSDGWILQTVDVKIKTTKSCKLIIDLTSLAGVNDKTKSTVLVTGLDSSSIREFVVQGAELPTRLEMIINESSTVYFENVLSETVRGADVRPLSARGFVSCTYVD
jgi:hypothetical protein